MTIAIAAMGLNRAIGHEGRIPWHLPKDMKFFRRTTMGHVVVMGRKTFDSLGRSLPGRENVVLSRSPRDIPGVVVVPQLSDYTVPAGKTLFVIGGAEIYRMLLPVCDELLLTVVKQSPAADTFFPEFEVRFRLAEILEEDADLEIRRYVHVLDAA